MRKAHAIFRSLSAALGLFAAVCCCHSIVAGETALDRYVAKKDPTYSWKIVENKKQDGASAFVVDLKSQTWRTPEDVDRTVWQHWLTVVKPEKPVSHTAFLFITGGSNGGSPPQNVDAMIARFAQQTNCVIAELKMVPNEPLVFHKDGKKRTEDDIIGYTWAKFLAGGDDEWPARLPMTKSAVRAMDCVQELLKSEQGGGFNVDKFVVAGGSKRGWTTWCTAAVDKRVAAIVPSSIDCLNGPLSIRHHIAVYGFYSQAIGDYVRHGIVRQMDNPRMKLLNEIEDPYFYRDRFTMPKYVVNASGDQYFPPDNSQFYFDELPGEKYLRYVPNVAHNLQGSDARDSIAAFFYSVATGGKRPKYSWTFEPDGSIHVKAEEMTPKAVTLWQANNPEARDFRLQTIGKAYQPTPLKDEGNGTYVAKIDKPAKGWTASFVELMYDIGAPSAFQISTAVRVTPDTLPFKDMTLDKAPAETRQQRRAVNSTSTIKQ